MKNLINLILILVLSANLLHAQEKVESIDSIYVQSDTVYAEVDYDFYYDGSKYYDGVVGYLFTVEDTINKVSLEGSYDGVQYVNVADLDSLSNDNYSISDVDPEYQKYRLGAYGASGDTAILKNIIYYEKKTGR